MASKLAERRKNRNVCIVVSLWLEVAFCEPFELFEDLFFPKPEFTQLFFELFGALQPEELFFLGAVFSP